MNGAFNGRQPDAPAPLMIIAAAVLIAAGVGASVWTLWHTLRAPPGAAPEALAAAKPAPAMPAAVPAQAAAPARGGEFTTDFEQMRQRAQTARTTAEVLRRARRANANSAWTEEMIKAVERGDVAIR